MYLKARSRYRAHHLHWLRPDILWNSGGFREHWGLCRGDWRAVPPPASDRLVLYRHGGRRPVLLSELYRVLLYRRREEVHLDVCCSSSSSWRHKRHKRLRRGGRQASLTQRLHPPRIRRLPCRCASCGMAASPLYCPSGPALSYRPLQASFARSSTPPYFTWCSARPKAM